MRVELISVLISVGLGLLIFGGFWASVKASQRNWDRVQTLATSWGLAMAPRRTQLGIVRGFPRASGILSGKSVDLFGYSTGAGKSRTRWSAFSANPRETGGLTFSFSRQGIGSKIRGLFGAQEIVVGDSDFDRTWFIQSNHADFIRTALLPELRAKIQATARQGTLKLNGGRVTYSERGTFSESRCARFLLVAETVCDLADVAEVYARQKT